MTQNREIEQRKEAMKKLAQAQDVIYEAWEASSQTLRVSLAKRALAISPLCADAYVLLAEAATTINERLQLYEKGVEAGEQALGAEIFKTNAGSFWGRLETRPYMRARAGFAQSLWEAGRQKEAIDHLEEMLRLNPNDNQGNRFLLLQYLLTFDDVAATKALLAKYPRDTSAIWTYARALLAYRDKAPDAEAIVKEAWRWNPYVPGVLSGSRSPVEPTNGGLMMGGPDEATHYARIFGAFWRAAPGAIEWLTTVTKDLPPPNVSLKARPTTSDVDTDSFNATLHSVLRSIADTADKDSLATFQSVADAPGMAAAAAAARQGDIDLFNFEMRSIDNAIDGLLMSALPDARDAHFLFRESRFIESHYRNVIQKYEGSACCADKSRNIMRKLFGFLTKGTEIVFDRTAQYTFNQPTKVFVEHAEIVDFFNALKRFHYGDPMPYLCAFEAIATRMKQGATTPSDAEQDK